MKCNAKTKDGKRCQAHALVGSEFCYYHDPASGKKRREAQSRGGSKRSLEVMPTPPFDLDLADPRGIPKFLTLVANGVVRGQFDTKVAYTVAYLADCAMRAHKAGELTERVAEMARLQRVEHYTPISQPRDLLTQFEDEDQPAEVQGEV